MKPYDVMCKYCKKVTQHKKPASFCDDACRSRWHAAEKKKKELFTYRTLRTALQMCVDRYPDLREDVNNILSEAGLKLKEGSV